jgi:hypothetical protein
MSAHREFFEAQQLLNNIFYTGHMISDANVDYLVSELRQHAYRMVRYNLEEHNRSTPTIQVLAPPQPARRPALRAPPPVRRNPLEKSKVISKKKLEEPCPGSCAVCLETPKHKDSICTECNHYFCKPCWNSWMNAERSNKKCPTCRKDMPRTTSFKARAVRRLIVVEDEGF